MKYTKIILLILTLALLLGACAPAQAPENHDNIIPLNPAVHEGQCPDADPYAAVNKENFYANYTPACCWTNAKYRSLHGLLSGSLEVPGQYVTEAENRPMAEGKFVRNTTAYYLDGGSTYVITDATGREVMRIYKGGAYITLEEVAAYMYAFGGTKDSYPANYTYNKKARPSESIWGEYLRLNHSKFSGNTRKYPYEPKLPDISGCGGDLQYYEMDIGTTGTETPGGYALVSTNTQQHQTGVQNCHDHTANHGGHDRTDTAGHGCTADEDGCDGVCLPAGAVRGTGCGGAAYEQDAGYSSQ